MARLEIPDRETQGKPPSVEAIEVRPWGLAGAQAQQFYIGSGFNFSADGNFWLEILYTVQGAALFYTRNFLHDSSWDADSTPKLKEALEEFASGERDRFGFGDMLPETGVLLRREKYTHQEKTHTSYALEIAVDTGAVFGFDSPGERTINIQLKYIPFEAGVQFMRELIDEIGAAYQGKHPDPAGLDNLTSEWAFERQLNRRAYNRIAETYQEDYFSNPNLKAMFEAWLAEIPAGGCILDAGCGHGDPVINRLLEGGFQVTGIDQSPQMLERARAKFPQVPLINIPVSRLEVEAEFDGACSLSSLLYLDPAEFFHSLYRLYRALKPGGLLFLYAYDSHPDWRGLPYDLAIDHWMWSWVYSLDEAVKAVEEHGYFEVIQAREVTTEEEKAQRIARWKKRRQENYEKHVQHLPPDAPVPTPPDPDKEPGQLAYCYAILARRTQAAPSQGPA
jgi:SAM-dependent methyltransferase